MMLDSRFLTLFLRIAFPLYTPVFCCSRRRFIVVSFFYFCRFCNHSFLHNADDTRTRNRTENPRRKKNWYHKIDRHEITACLIRCQKLISEKFGTKIACQT